MNGNANMNINKRLDRDQQGTEININYDKIAEL